MNTLSLTLFLLLGPNHYAVGTTDLETVHQMIKQDTTSAKVWKQRAEAAERSALQERRKVEIAVKDALEQKALSVSLAAEVVRLKKMLEDCQGKKKE